MKVLIACEFSGIVRDAFIARGHDAASCDPLDSERPGPHIKGDVSKVLRSRRWDIMIATHHALACATAGFVGFARGTCGMRCVNQLCFSAG